MRENLKETLTELGIHRYEGTRDEDIIIAEWWDALFGTEEFANLVASSAHSLSDLYQLFKPPNVMTYTVQDGTIESIHWLEPVTTSRFAIFLASWASKQLRGTKRHAELMRAIYELIFAMGKCTILGITKQEKLLDLHKKMGYVILDSIPNLFDQDQAWIMYLTQEAFETSRLYAAATKITNKELN